MLIVVIREDERIEKRFQHLSLMLTVVIVAVLHYAFAKLWDHFIVHWDATIILKDEYCEGRTFNQVTVHFASVESVLKDILE